MLERAVGCWPRAARVFVGDVRNLALLARSTPRCSSHRRRPRLTVEQLRESVARALAREKELLVDPDFFAALREHPPRIGAVDVQLKRGRSDNELTRYPLRRGAARRPAMPVADGARRLA